MPADDLRTSVGLRNTTMPVELAFKNALAKAWNNGATDHCNGLVVLAPGLKTFRNTLFEIQFDVRDVLEELSRIWRHCGCEERSFR